jgi:hypothetical protein
MNEMHMIDADNESFLSMESELHKLIENGILLDMYDDFETRRHIKNRVFVFLKTSLCTRKFLNGLIFEILFEKDLGKILIAIVEEKSGNFIETNMSDALENLHPELQKFVSFNINYFVETHYPTALD